MARHNREGQGADQKGHQYTISYQPDWLRFVKVTRDLDTGRQSTKTLFRNPLQRREAEPGDRVRTRVVSRDHNLDFELALADPYRVVTRLRVTCLLPGPDGSREEEIEFTFEGRLPGP